MAPPECLPCGPSVPHHPGNTGLPQSLSLAVAACGVRQVTATGAPLGDYDHGIGNGQKMVMVLDLHDPVSSQVKLNYAEDEASLEAWGGRCLAIFLSRRRNAY